MSKQKNLIGLYSIGILFSAYAFFQLSSLNTLSTYFIITFSITPSTIAHLSSLYLFIDALCLIPAGLLLDKINLKILIPTAILFLIMGVGVVTTSHNLYQLFIGKALSGVGHAFAFLTGFRLTKKCLTQKYQSIGISLVVTVAMMGGLMAQTPFEILIRHIGWRLAMLSNCSLGIILLFYSLFMLQCAPTTLFRQEKSEQYTLKNFYTTFIKAAKTPANYLIGFVIGLLSTPLILFGSTIGNLYLINVIHLSAYHSSLLSIFLFLSTSIGMLLFSWLNDRLDCGLFLVFLATCLSILTAAILIFISSYHIVIQGLLFFLIAFFASAQTIGYVLVYKYNPISISSTGMAFTNVIIMVICAFIPLTASIFDLSRSMYILLVSLALVLPILAIIKKLRPLRVM